MGKIRLTVKTNYGEISVEGDSLQDFKATLLDIGFSQNNVSNILATILDATSQKFPEPFAKVSVSVTPSKPELAGIVEYTSDGAPKITVAQTRLSLKTVIGLLLYAKSPNAVSMSELTDLVNDNWKTVEMTTVSGILSFMRPYVIKEGTRGSYSYRLSGMGKSWVENELIPKLKRTDLHT